MGTMNWFGVSYTDVADMYVTGGQNDTQADVVADMGGQTIIEGVLEDITLEVLNTLCSDVHGQLYRIRLQEATREGGADVDTATVTGGDAPAESSPNLDVWRFASRPDFAPKRFGNGWQDEGASDYSYDVSTSGVLTVTFPSDKLLSDGEMVYISYDLDTDSAFYEETSLGAVVKLGAAARLGPRLYTQGDVQGWQLVEYYRIDYRGTAEERGKLSLLADCSYVPTFYRNLRFWEDLEPDQGLITSVPIFRA